MRHEEVFGLMKTLVDAHTMGIDTAVSLLRECNYSFSAACSEGIGNTRE
mgnify:CR=1 FL=1